jgi:cytochrome c peroxidase
MSCRYVCLILVFLIAGFAGGFQNSAYEFPELKHFPQLASSVENTITTEGVALGRRLFYDPVLSADSTMSCSSCHRQEAAFSDSPNRFSSGRNHTPTKRNSMPLFNLSWYPAFFWDGRAASIEDQVFHPVRDSNEMNFNWIELQLRLEKNNYYRGMFSKVYGDKEIDSTMISDAVSQFLRTILSYRSKYDRVINHEDTFTADEYEGFVLVNDQTKGNCIHCHITDGAVLATTLVFSNNGLDSAKDYVDYPDKGYGSVTGNPKDNGKFIVPSLRNLLFTAPYMHDGRFSTLQEVLDFYTSGVQQGINTDSKMLFMNPHGVNLSKEEKRKIISFLVTLTDSALVKDPKYSIQ